MRFCQIWSPANNAIFRPEGKMLGTLGTRNDDKCHDGRIGPLCSDKAENSSHNFANNLLTYRVLSETLTQKLV